jgi:hypothetical protein
MMVKGYSGAFVYELFDFDEENVIPVRKAIKYGF